MLEAVDRVQRFWRLGKGDLQAVAAIAEGHVPDLIDEPLPGSRFSAIVSVALMGPPSERRYPDGRIFYACEVLESAGTKGWAFPALEPALAWLDGEKAELLAAGWIELELDPVADPD